MLAAAHNQLIRPLARHTGGVEETLILAHVQGKGLHQICSIPGESAGHKPDSTVGGGASNISCSHPPCTQAVLASSPDNVPEPLCVRLLRIEVVDLWLQLTIHQRVTEPDSTADKVSGPVCLRERGGHMFTASQ